MEDLNFQDYSDKAGLLLNDESSSRSNRLVNQTDPENTEEKKPSAERRYHFYDVEYWQSYFDVDSREVAERLVRSFLPTRRHVLGEILSAKPDFYGPFWSVVTLIFLLGLSTNVRTYFAQAPEQQRIGTARRPEADDKYEFEYDFQLVPAAIGMLTAYFVLSAIFEALAVKCLRVSVRYSFAALACAHGYALSVFNFAAIIWLVNEAWLAWLTTIVCTLLSGLSLVRTLHEALQPATRLGSDNNSDGIESQVQFAGNSTAQDGQLSQLHISIEKMRRFAVPITIVTVSMFHVVLATAFMLVFFYR